MPKVQINIDQITTTRHKVIVEIDNIDDLENLLDTLESKGSHPDDIAYYLNNEFDTDCKIVEFIKGEPNNCEFEISDYDEL